MRSRQLLALAASGVLVLGAGACGSSKKKTTTAQGGGGAINGAGATFPQPVYDEWGSRFKSKTDTIVLSLAQS